MRKMKIVVPLLAAGVVLILCWYGGRDNTPQTSAPCAPSYTPSLPPDSEGALSHQAQQHVLFTIVSPEYIPSGFYFVETYVRHGAAVLVYESEYKRITISQWEEEQYAHHPYPGEEKITFNGITAYFSVPGPYNLL